MVAAARHTLTPVTLLTSTLILAGLASAYSGRGAVTQYAWSNADCAGPMLEVLATYQLGVCVLSVIPADGHLLISYDNASAPTGVVYSHYSDAACTLFVNNDTEGLLACTPGNLGSE
jgi:hypothetical protein